MPTKTARLFCVIPFYNEEAWLPRLIEALKRQSETDVSYIFVDNGSSDNSVAVIEHLSRGLDFELISETQKGTGAASATGFTYAVTKGATHIARLDADCAPDTNWAARARSWTTTDVGLVLGFVQCSPHDPQYRFYDRAMFLIVRIVSTLYGRMKWRGPQYKAPFFYGIGNNFMVSAEAYEAVGGFERTAIDEADEDGILFDAIRRYTPRVVHDKLMRSNPSLRRIRKYGYIRTMLHYWGRKYRAPVIDVR